MEVNWKLWFTFHCCHVNSEIISFALYNKICFEHHREEVRVKNKVLLLCDET